VLTVGPFRKCTNPTPDPFAQWPLYALTWHS
jgi:hypothetical protein